MTNEQETIEATVTPTPILIRYADNIDEWDHATITSFTLYTDDNQPIVTPLTDVDGNPVTIALKRPKRIEETDLELDLQAEILIATAAKVQRIGEAITNKDVLTATLRQYYNTAYNMLWTIVYVPGMIVKADRPKLDKLAPIQREGVEGQATLWWTKRHPTERPAATDSDPTATDEGTTDEREPGRATDAQPVYE